MGLTDEVIAIIKQNISLHMASVYEKVVMEILRVNGDLLFSFDLLGRWWDKNDEIDIVGINKERKLTLFSEVKWSNKLAGINGHF